MVSTRWKEQPVTSISSKVLRLVLRVISGCVLAFLLYEYGMAVNHGTVPRSVDEVLSYAWLVLILAAFVPATRYLERQSIPQVSKEKFNLRPGERLLFSSSSMSGQYFVESKSFNPCPSILGLFHWPARLCVDGMLRVKLTDKRFVVGTVLGYTWRDLPLSSIIRVEETSGNWLYRRVLVVEYEFDGRREAIVIRNKSAKGRALSNALLASVYAAI